ncbi:hypothetical protein GCM10010510_66080 [Streptomyces anandii JCM 4720]|nr:hypothetical protein GCM10010510_66080 [Streptomyces anandii JCM 4720]
MNEPSEFLLNTALRLAFAAPLTRDDDLRLVRAPQRGPRRGSGSPGATGGPWNSTGRRSHPLDSSIFHRLIAFC